jgi:hypothetical protein
MMKYKHLLAIFLACLVLSYSSFAARRMMISREVTLAPGHHALPYLITRTSNGDFVVAGSTGIGDFRAWATRVDRDGKRLWEYVDGGPGAWEDLNGRGQRFYGAVDLPNQETLLCGIKSDADNSLIGFLVRVRRDGSIIDQRRLTPGRRGDVVGLVCTRWADGIAVVGAITGRPAGIGWLVKLDAQGNIAWEKFDKYYGYGGAIQAPAGNLILIGGSGADDSIVKIDPDGEVLARHLRPDGESLLVNPPTPRPGVRMGVMLLDSLETEVVDFDDSLRGPSHAKKLENAGIKKCLELDDGTVVLFGGQFHNSATTASIAVLQPDGTSSAYPIEPANHSPWIIDAVPSGADGEFATVRQVDGAAILAWISIR